jgi:pimeloyl-ACP methyl ester carboxylesterase
MGKVMEKELADAGLVVFEGAGHYAFVDQGPRFTAISRSFFP